MGSFSTNNNKAIAHLTNEDFASAYHTFKSSLKCFTTLLTNQQAYGTGYFPIIQQQLGGDNVHITPIQIRNDCQEEISSHTLAMYTRAFVISPQAPWFEETINWSDKPIVTAALLYNMALSLHLSGIIHGENTMHLREALKIYRMALSFLEENYSLFPPKNHGISSKIVVRMAILNNIGNLCSMLYELKCVDVALLHMTKILECPNCLVALDDHDQMLFSTNVLFYAEHPFASTAPAA